MGFNLEKKANPLSSKINLTKARENDTEPYVSDNKKGSYLAQKWLTAKTCEDMDALCNEFNATHTVKFSQTHVSVAATDSGYQTIYTCVMFYEGGPVADAKRKDVI